MKSAGALDRAASCATSIPSAVEDCSVFSSVETESGKVIDTDLVVMGTGAMPDVMLARSSGLELGETGGVACSSSLATSAPGVWCAGDACEYDSFLHGHRVRIEHWEVARAQVIHD